MAGRKSKYTKVNQSEKVEKVWNTAIYIRLSQEDSDNGADKKESNSITSQKALLTEYVEDKIDLMVYDTYIDDGFSGTDFERPGFKRLLDDMRNCKINCVLVKDLSRIGRNYIEVGNYIEQVFPLFNIRFISVNDNIDSFKNPTSVNSILVPFKNLINDEYARDTSIKIKSALNSRKKKGEFIGAFPSYGYLKDEKNKHKLIVDEEAAKIVKRIFEWKVNEGLGNLAICYRLNDMGILNPTGYKRKKLNLKYNNSQIEEDDYTWCPSTVRNILKNDVYVGNVTQGKRRVKSYKIHKIEQVSEDEWITVENMHEPIIDRNLFEKAQNISNTDTRVLLSGKRSIWAGLLKCGDCGRAMHKKDCKNKSGKVYEYFVCGTYRKKSNKLCTKHTISIKELEEAVLEAINESIRKFANNKKIDQQIDRLKTSVYKDENITCLKFDKEIKRINILKRSLYEDWKNGDISRDEYIEYKQAYEDDIKKIKENVLKMNVEREKQKKINSLNNECIDSFKKNKKFLKLDRSILTELIDYIEVFENHRIKIYFKFIND